MKSLLYVIAAVLVVIWLITFLGGLIVSAFIHLLLVIAVILVILNLVGTRRRK